MCESGNSETVGKKDENSNKKQCATNQYTSYTPLQIYAPNHNTWHALRTTLQQRRVYVRSRGCVRARRRRAVNAEDHVCRGRKRHRSEACKQRRTGRLSPRRFIPGALGAGPTQRSRCSDARTKTRGQADQTADAGASSVDAPVAMRTRGKGGSSGRTRARP